MIRALIEGRKSKTRRLAWKRWYDPDLMRDEDRPSPWQRVQPGDRLWVRENVQAIERDDGTDGVGYPADDAWLPIQSTTEAAERWGALFYYRGRGKGRIGNPVPSIHMPRWASRLTLTVTAVRVERLQAISEQDAAAEGVEPPAAEREDHDWSICPKCGGTGLHGALGHSLGVMEVDCVECATSRQRFRHLWSHLHGEDAWDANPEVVVISFDVRKGNIDA